ncbi:MAG: hypothetical protein LQ351_006201 [Letrouitia transgressa]|nr:MAG: hypothetical protein LQ351_006201 [Letrouitia transgressa]
MPATERRSCATAAVFKACSTRFARSKTPETAFKPLPAVSSSRLHSSLSESAYDLSDDPAHIQTTVLYLAYGSNLSAETFIKGRGIRPLSAVNVAVPELVMTFDLPGLPYIEPCFANTAYRNLSSKFSPQALAVGSTPAPDPEKVHASNQNEEPCQPQWPHPLIGVVYEVTPSDYAHIIATEGGGASYTDILVSCYPLGKDLKDSPQRPTGPIFKAHTLLSPHTDQPAPPRFSRPDTDHAQPSARYLKLLTDGAAEHCLPSDYQEYLQSLQPFTITTRGQIIGKWVFTVTWLPAIIVAFGLSKILSDNNGKIPTWFATLLAWIFWSVWVSYDRLFKRIFGDGEKTVEDSGKSGQICLR